MSSSNHGAPTIHGPAIELTHRTPKGGHITMDETELEGKADALDEVDSQTKSTANDAIDMRRMGKEQQLIRRFRQITITAFLGTAVSAWEYALFLVSPGLVDGGRAGLMYNVIWAFCGFACVYLSLAEMASMAPIAGSLYHWVSEFAPEKYQRPMSYITGWTSTIAWQAGLAQGMLLAGTQIQTIILIMNENYAYPSWQGTLLSFAAILASYVITTFGIRSLPYWQVPVFAISLMCYFGYIVPVWVSSPTATHKEVWTGFSNTGGWPNMALAVLVGQLSGIGMQTGVDTAAHMAEEVKDAAVAIPRAMMTIYTLDVCLVFPLIVTIVYHLPDVAAALEDPTEYPGVYILRSAMSDAWISVLMAIITLVVMGSNITFLAAVSRDLFAFARDKGLPFSGWLSKVEPKRSIPLNASIFSCLLSAALALIYIGSDVAFYAITSLSTVAVLQCYIFAIGCVLWRRLTAPETLPPAQWSLGKYGIYFNFAAVFYSVWCFFWCFWPQAQPVTAGGFNWAGPIYVLALIVATIYYFVRARHFYEGPVTEVEGRNVARIRQLASL